MGLISRVSSRTYREIKKSSNPDKKLWKKKKFQTNLPATPLPKKLAVCEYQRIELEITVQTTKSLTMRHQLSRRTWEDSMATSSTPLKPKKRLFLKQMLRAPTRKKVISFRSKLQCQKLNRVISPCNKILTNPGK